MSEKIQVTTFKVTLVQSEGVLEGPVVSPDQRQFAQRLTDIHQFCSEYQGILLYAKQWTYLPFHSILHVQKGSQWFSLPWPLRED